MTLLLATGSFTAYPGDKTYRFLAPAPAGEWHVAFANFSVLTDGAVADIAVGNPVLTNDGWTGTSGCKVEVSNSGSGNVVMTASLLVSDEEVGQVTVTNTDLVVGTGWGLVSDV